MSDEQTMPEVMTRKWYPTLATRMAGDSSVAAMVDCEQRYNQEAYVTYADHLATIATLTAERDALRGDVQAAIDTIKQNQAKHDALCEAVKHIDEVYCMNVDGQTLADAIDSALELIARQDQPTVR